jgi:hypothetical protein
MRLQSYFRKRWLHARLQITMPLKSFHWPADAAAVRARFWRAGTAAASWGCSYRAAARWFRDHASLLVLVRLQHAGGAVTHWVCVRAGQAQSVATCAPETAPLVRETMNDVRRATVARQLLATVPVVRYHLPADRATIRATYWAPIDAARAWGCSYQAARRWLLLHPDHAIVLELVRPDRTIRARLVMLAGQERIRAQQGGRGNPSWQDSATQSALVSRRWRRPAPQPADAPPWD